MSKVYPPSLNAPRVPLNRDTPLHAPEANDTRSAVEQPAEKDHTRVNPRFEEKLVALVKALARSAAETDFRGEREQNGRTTQ